ncbi:MAG TPA: antibiotic biosynthesis monooxygenase [Ignavibacteriaceae bacterium]|nr:antibiotic biosynthesis monooxygenase [Ignavibacteriaceae bacterium]
MFMRFVQLNVDSQKIPDFRRVYSEDVIQALQKIPGCRFVGLIESGSDKTEFISMTLWDKQEQAEDYEKKGIYADLLEKIKPFLRNSSEWKIQLSEKLELEYKEVVEEPVIKRYSVQTQLNSVDRIDSRLYVRIVSLSIQKGKEKEFKQIYTDEIIPELLSTQGCQYAYLTQSLQDPDSFISVTIWDSKEDAELYESTGKFKELVDKASHTFSQFYRWKMALEKDYNANIRTSEDMKIDSYNLVTGKNFI